MSISPDTRLSPIAFLSFLHLLNPLERSDKSNVSDDATLLVSLNN